MQVFNFNSIINTEKAFYKNIKILFIRDMNGEYIEAFYVENIENSNLTIRNCNDT